MGPQDKGLEYHDVSLSLQGKSAENTQRSVLDSEEINWRNKDVFFSCKVPCRLSNRCMEGKETTTKRDLRRIYKRINK